MNTPQHIANALERVKSITSHRNADIIQSKEMERTDRELLLRTQWLQEIIKGWYMLVRPDLADGDSTAWYTNFWDFLRVYLEERFGDQYCLSVESSLDLYTQSSFIPKQVVIVVPQGGSNTYSLPYDTSLLIYNDAKNFPSDRVLTHELYTIPLALAVCKSPVSYFQNHASNAEIALRLVKHPSDLSKIIVELNFKSAADRLIGAYQFLGNTMFADSLFEDLKNVGMILNPKNPFKQVFPLISQSRITSPYAARIEALWSILRAQVLSMEPKVLGIPENSTSYMKHIDEIYKYDAYNSLSIEGYKVTYELIQQVKENKWNPDFKQEDKDIKNALAAKGYYEAFQAVKHSVEKILNHKNPGEVLSKELQNWYRKLFSPSTHAGILTAGQLIGYRDQRVYIKNSRHIPPPKEAVIDAMEALFNCVKIETSAFVRAVLGHYLFVFIHPYMDGNGRLSRFLMNAMLASGGYPWTVIEVTKRERYINCLNVVDESQNIKPFTELILEEMNNTRTVGGR